MANIGLISCVSTKRKFAAKAKDLYNSPLFNYSKDYACKILDGYFILSAKYGLVKPDQIIEPYEETLNNKSQKERISWTYNVYSDIEREISKNDRIVFLAGERYKEILNNLLIQNKYKTTSPLNKLSIGRQLQWYKGFNENATRVKELDRLYGSIEKLKKGLGGLHKLSEIDGASKLPKKGVYLFFENGEYRTTSPFTEKVTRVGTHAVSKGSSSTLWNRLRTHRGSIDKKGNHRGSIFRLHVGNSIINKKNINSSTWGIGQTASKEIKENEEELEKLVSKYIGSMRILWLNIQDESSKYSDRAYIEKNLIALLSSFDYRLDISSVTWLGNYNDNLCIQRSSLWNVNYVDLKYDSRFFDIFDYYIDVTLGKLPSNNKSMVPEDWHHMVKNDSQLKLFD